MLIILDLSLAFSVMNIYINVLESQTWNSYLFYILNIYVRCLYYHDVKMAPSYFESPDKTRYTFSHVSKQHNTYFWKRCAFEMLGWKCDAIAISLNQLLKYDWRDFAVSMWDCLILVNMQNISRNMHACHALFWFLWLWFWYSYPYRVLHCHQGNITIAFVQWSYHEGSFEVNYTNTLTLIVSPQ